ncbi:hypothetical protein FA15DRAFT_659400, partial [Coprinopsis marcescibilis]
MAHKCLYILLLFALSHFSFAGFEDFNAPLAVVNTDTIGSLQTPLERLALEARQTGTCSAGPGGLFHRNSRVLSRNCSDMRGLNIFGVNKRLTTLNVVRVELPVVWLGDINATCRPVERLERWNENNVELSRRYIKVECTEYTPQKIHPKYFSDGPNNKISSTKNYLVQRSYEPSPNIFNTPPWSVIREARDQD